MVVWVVQLIVLFIVSDWSAESSHCYQKFWKNNYIPKFADDVKSVDLKVVYAGTSIKCDSTVNIIQAAEPPTLYFNVPKRCQYVTVLSFAPDAIVGSPYLTWLVINIPPGNLRQGFTTPSLGENKNNNGYVVSDYIIPKDPTGGSGVRKNTIIYFIYCQCYYIKDKTKIVRPFRANFNVTKYAKDKSLKCPVAALFHRFSPTGVTLPTVVKSPI